MVNGTRTILTTMLELHSPKFPDIAASLIFWREERAGLSVLLKLKLISEVNIQPVIFISVDSKF
jgi:hypothetical protein